jgi:hypothetical protein
MHDGCEKTFLPVLMATVRQSRINGWVWMEVEREREAGGGWRSRDGVGAVWAWRGSRGAPARGRGGVVAGLRVGILNRGPKDVRVDGVCVLGTCVRACVRARVRA